MIRASRGGLTGWKYAAFIGVFIGMLGAVLYPVTIYPMQNIEKYKKVQAVTRANIVQDDVQPGNMRVWSDPFASKSK